MDANFWKCVSRSAPLVILGALATSIASGNDLRALVVHEAGDGINRLQLMQASELAASLSSAVAQKVVVDRTTDLANALRSTRTGEYDIYIVPGHVAASAASHGFTPLAATKDYDQFVFVAKSEIVNPSALGGRRVYLPHQDSLHSYMAKGLLNEAGGSLSASKVDYKRIADVAGLVSIQMGTHDATVARKADFEMWRAQQNVLVRVLAESKQIPTGPVLLVKDTLGPALSNKLSTWAVAGGATRVGLGKMATLADVNVYRYLGELSNFTPQQLPGVTRVDAARVRQMLSQGAQLIDVRSEKEFRAKRVPGAVWVPYLEKSLKEASYNPSVDDFTAASKLDRNKPTIFACNGAECWKSYKASKTATAAGFTKVFWFRGGLPEWETAGLPVEKS